MKKPKKSLERLLGLELGRVVKRAKREALQPSAAGVRVHHFSGLKRLHARGLTPETLAEALRRTRGPKDPRSRKPREGGEPVPAIPRPKPKPLSGGAAARLERGERKPRLASPRRLLPVSPPDGDETGIRL